MSVETFIYKYEVVDHPIEIVESCLNIRSLNGWEFTGTLPSKKEDFIQLIFKKKIN